MKILKQQKKAYHAPYLKCFHHITAEQILAGSPPTGTGQNPESGTGDETPGNSFDPTKQTSFFFEEEEEEGDEESGYYW